MCEFGDKQKTHLKACFFTHLYLANTHLKVCKNTHLFRKIHTLTCVKKHALRCVNLATEGVLKIHTLFFRVYGGFLKQSTRKPCHHGNLSFSPYALQTHLYTVPCSEFDILQHMRPQERRILRSLTIS